MDIGTAFTYVFDDEDWIKKIAIGGGLYLLALPLMFVVVGIALMFPILGYMIQTLKNVRDGHQRPLPEWTNFGDLFMSGLMVFIIGLAYNIPAILLSCLSLPLQFAMNPEFVDESMLAVLGILVFCMSCLQVAVSIFLNALLPAAYIRYAMTDSIGSAFQIGAIFSFVSNNIGDYIITILLTWVAGIVSGFGIILCCIGLFFTSFWSILVGANLYGQLAQRMDGGGKEVFGTSDFAPAQ